MFDGVLYFELMELLITVLCPATERIACVATCSTGTRARANTRARMKDFAQHNHKNFLAFNHGWQEALHVEKIA